MKAIFMRQAPLSKFSVFIMAIVIGAAVSFTLPPPLPAQADKDKARLGRALQRSMLREAPLSEDDYRLYLANLENIFALRQAPERAAEVAADISEWSESRFAYVTTKMAVGMSMLLQPDNPRNQAVPDFAEPTESEMRLIRNHRDELVKSMEALQASQGQ